MAIRVKQQKQPPSGAAANEVPKNDWEHFESMRFLEKFLKTRKIISSNKLRNATVEKRPEEEQFCKNRKATVDKYSLEYKESKKLLAVAVEEIKKHNQQIQMPVNVKKEQVLIDGFLQAVLDCLDDLSDGIKFEGFMLAMSEIKKEYALQSTTDY